jgi:hypothetical protein
VEVTSPTRSRRTTATRSPTSPVDGGSVGAVSGYTFANVHAGHTIAATFSLNGPYTIAASAGAGGNISPAGAVSVACGAAQEFYVGTSASCLVVADVIVDGVSMGPIEEYTFTNVHGAHTIEATFTTAPGYTIDASAGAGGTISPSGATPVACGGEQAFAIAASDCYSIADVTVDGGSVGAVSGYTFTNAHASHTIVASFSLNGPYTIAASAGTGGTISPNGAVSVACGADQAFTVHADDCYTLADVAVDGASQGAVSGYTFTNVHGGHTIAATFSLNGPYTIAASATTGGIISPAGTVSVACGSEQEFYVGTSVGCLVVADVVVDGVSMGPIEEYTFSNVHRQPHDRGDVHHGAGLHDRRRRRVRAARSRRAARCPSRAAPSRRSRSRRTIATRSRTSSSTARRRARSPATPSPTSTPTTRSRRASA